MRTLVALGFCQLALLLGSTAYARTGGAFGYELQEEVGGGLTLKLTSDVTERGIWLGVTVYPPTGKAVHLLYPIKAGYAVTAIPVDPKQRHGTFEGALWSQKISKEHCTASDTPCRKQGYRLSGMRAYVWGALRLNGERVTPPGSPAPQPR